VLTVLPFGRRESKELAKAMVVSSAYQKLPSGPGMAPDSPKPPPSPAASDFRRLISPEFLDIDQAGDSREEMAAILGLAGPIIASSALQISMGFVDSIIVGHLGSMQLAAAALGNMWFNCCWFFCFGFLSTVDTFASQAYGAGKLREVDAVACRGIIVAVLLMLIMAFAMYHAEWAMSHAMLLDPELSAMVGVFTKALIPGLWPFALFTVLQKYLQAKNEMKAPVIITLVANFFNAGIGYTLVYRTSLGFQGAPIATSLSRCFMFVSIIIYLFCKRRQKGGLFSVPCKAVFRSGAFTDFLRLGFPGALSMSLEAWAFDATTLMAGLLHDTAALSAHSVALNLSGLTFFALPFGVGIACSIRIGNLLGAGRGQQAKLSYRLSMFLGCGSMAFVGVLFIVFAKKIGYIWSSNAQVISDIATIMPIVAVFQVLEGFQGVASGTMRGMGFQKVAAKLNLAGFWVVGIPLGYVFCFKVGLGLPGIWWGTCSGLIALSLGDAFVLARGANWDELADQIATRLRELSTNTPDGVTSQGSWLGSPRYGARIVPVFDSDNLAMQRAEQCRDDQP